MDLSNAFMTASIWIRELVDSGMDMTTNAAHKKVAHEAAEFADTPTLEEAADVFISLATALTLAGFSSTDLSSAVYEKMAINRARTWVQKDDGTWQHS